MLALTTTTTRERTVRVLVLVRVRVPVRVHAPVFVVLVLVLFLVLAIFILPACLLPAQQLPPPVTILLACPPDTSFFPGNASRYATYEDVALAVRNHTAALSIPVKYMLLDSYWYYRSTNGGGTKR